MQKNMDSGGYSFMEDLLKRTQVESNQEEVREI